jgi:hypothetical protein
VSFEGSSNALRLVDLSDPSRDPNDPQKSHRNTVVAASCNRSTRGEVGIVVRNGRFLLLGFIAGCSVYEAPVERGTAGGAGSPTTLATGGAGGGGANSSSGGQSGSGGTAGEPGTTSAGGAPAAGTTGGASAATGGQSGGGAGGAGTGAGAGGSSGSGREAGADAEHPPDGSGGTGGGSSKDAGADVPGTIDTGTRSDASDGGSPDVRVLEDPIDDMQDNNVPHYILPLHGRVGYWFTVNDATDGGVQSPAANMFGLSSGGYTSPYGANLSGQGFSTWGLYMGFTLNKTLQGVRNMYDASAYVGISFWAKLGPNDKCTSPAACRLVHLAISTRDTDQQGGICTTACSDHFGYWQSLTPNWKKYTILFRQLTQDGWGVPGPAEGLKFDAAHTYEVQFQVKPAGTQFDFWISDVAFVLP